MVVIIKIRITIEVALNIFNKTTTKKELQKKDIYAKNEYYLP